MGGYEDLGVWQRGREIVVLIYNQTRSFPKSEQFGVAGPMRRATVSVVANVAEGCARASSAEFAQFLNVARGSAAELETLLVIASDIGLVDSETAKAIESEVRACVECSMLCIRT